MNLKKVWDLCGSGDLYGPGPMRPREPVELHEPERRPGPVWSRACMAKGAFVAP